MRVAKVLLRPSFQIRGFNAHTDIVPNLVVKLDIFLSSFSVVKKCVKC